MLIPVSRSHLFIFRLLLSSSDGIVRIIQFTATNLTVLNELFIFKYRIP